MVLEHCTLAGRHDRQPGLRSPRLAGGRARQRGAVSLEIARQHVLLGHQAVGQVGHEPPIAGREESRGGHPGQEEQPCGLEHPLQFLETEGLLREGMEGVGTQHAGEGAVPKGQRGVRVGGYAVQYLLWLLAWWVVGRAALQGRLDHGWLLAWALLLVTMVPFRLLATWAQGKFAIGAGGLLKRRLLAGALQLEPEEIRHQGAGQFLGRVLEAEAVEALALSGGLLGVVAGMEVLIAAAVLGAGAGGWAHAFLLLTWVAVALLLGWHDYRQRRHWTAERLTLTHGLVERLVGYRTRLAQEARERWHDGEDQELARYLADSAALDRNASRLTAMVPRGWLCLGLLRLAPAFVSGHGSPVLLAIGLGGVFLAYRAFHKLGAGLSHLAGAAIAWGQVAPLFNAAARPLVGGSPIFALPSAFGADHADGAGPILEMHELVFRYRSAPVLQGCNLGIRAGDRLLLEGVSGGGKSTLAAILSGLRVPESGLLLFRGLDRQTWGSRAGDAASPPHPSSTKTTSSLKHSLLTCS